MKYFLDFAYILWYSYQAKEISRSGAGEARRAHNPKVVGSNPASATSNKRHPIGWRFLFYISIINREICTDSAVFFLFRHQLTNFMKGYIIHSALV